MTTIEKLKELKIARDCAMEYDYVPGKEEADNLVKYILRGDITVAELEPILEKFQGWSVDDINSRVYRLIDEL